MKTYTIRPLKWWVHRTYYEIAFSPGGRYEIDHGVESLWPKWIPDIGQPTELCNSITTRAAKAACARHHRKRMETMLKEVGGEK